MIWKTLTILVLVAAIAGGTGYFVYQFHLKPQKLDREEKIAAAEAPPPTPPPDPSLAAFEALKPQLEANTPEAASAISAFLEQFPDAPNSREARAALGKFNASAFFSPTPGPGKTEYAVVSGDSLVRIASKFKTGAELVYRVNQLPNINLRIGQQLVIPQFDASIVIDREAQTLTINNQGAFFREYPAVSFRLPGAASAGAEGKVGDKFVMKEGKRLPFGDKGYEEGERWILIGIGGLTVRSTPPTPPVAPPAEGTDPAAAATPTPSPAPMPAGIVLSPEDAAEVFVLVSRGTPVTIK